MVIKLNMQITYPNVQITYPNMPRTISQTPQVIKINFNKNDKIKIAQGKLKCWKCVKINIKILINRLY